MERLNKFDAWLMNHKPNARLSGASRLLTEFWFFGLKEASLFICGIIFYCDVFGTKNGIMGLTSL